MVHRRPARVRTRTRRQHRRHPRIAREAQGDPAHRRVELWIGIHQSAKASRGAVDRKRRSQGFSHRRCLGVREARKLHYQPWARACGRCGGADHARAEHGRPDSWHFASHRSPHRRRAGMSLLVTRAATRRARSAAEFGKVAVLLGGDSTEREISLLSGNAVLTALLRRGVNAHAFDPIVFAESFVTGDESTVGVLHDRGLPSIRIQPATEFYDYQAKYFRNDTQYHCPSGLDAKAEAELQAAALAAFQVTDCVGWGRVDFMRDRATDKFYFIEINTTPGMTDHSLVPMAARQSGIDFDELVWRVLETSFLRARK